MGGKMRRMCRMNRERRKPANVPADLLLFFFLYPAHPAYPLLSCFHFAPQQTEIRNAL
jgi:hypothetical protein